MILSLSFTLHGAISCREISTGIVTKSDFVTCQAIFSLQPFSFFFSTFSLSPREVQNRELVSWPVTPVMRHSQQGESNSQDCPEAFDTSDVEGRPPTLPCFSGDFFLGFAVPVNTSLENVRGRRKKKTERKRKKNQNSIYPMRN